MDSLKKSFRLNKNLTTLVAICICFVTFAYIYRSEIDYKKFRPRIPLKRSHKVFDVNYTLSDKWIVITTVFHPTEDIKKISQLSGWKIVIVADTKTPTDWSYENCVFLSVEAQQELDYEILSLVPYKSYTRKMIGYLYAIQHGAKYIYDTDDDNLPINQKLQSFTYTNFTSGLIYDSGDGAKFFNIYGHFGRPDIWPRGYPLELIGERKETNYNLCTQTKTPIIQQGLVDQDADVDAIYRMLHVTDKKRGLNINFDSFAPPVILPRNTYCPFNSQNTLFHYDAFWALMLPITVTFRVTDIWRGYWAQRLLHLIDERLGFVGPNARQKRNAHNYMKDYLDESQLYTDSFMFVKSLGEWNCTKVEFQECIIEMGEFMLMKNFWGTDDVRLTEAWIKDLGNIGYVFPTLDKQVNSSNDVNCRNASFISTLEKRQKISSTLTENAVKLNKLCGSVANETFFIHPEVNLFNHTKNVVLIVTINRNHYSQIPLLKTLYEPWFANVFFCSAFPSNWKSILRGSKLFNKIWVDEEKFSFINLSAEEMHYGYFHYICMNKVAHMRMTNVDGYFAIADDMLFNFWTPINIDKINYPISCPPHPEYSPWWQSEWGKVKVEYLARFLNSTKSLNFNVEPYHTLKKTIMEPAYCHSDIHYIPQHLIETYKTLSQLFFDHRVFLENAVPKILHLLGFAKNVSSVSNLNTFVNDETILKGTYKWVTRNGIYDLFNESHIFLHAVKASDLEIPDWRSKFCNVYLAAMVDNINQHN